MVEIVQAKERRQNVMGFDPFEAPFGKGGTIEAQKTESKTVNLQGISARVDRVTVDGLGRTKDDIVNNAVQDLFTAENFEDIIKKSHNVRLKLQSLGCFRNIAIHIDTSQGRGATPNGYEVTYEVKELKRVSGGITTHVSNNAGIVTFGGFFPNIFGRGESLRGEVSYGSNKSNTSNITFVKPFISSKNLVGVFSIFQGQNDYPACGHALSENGLLAELGFITLPKWRHKFQYEANWRILGAGNKSSFFVRDKAGHTLKSCLRHILTVDSRDSPVLPTIGKLCQLKTEIAGIGGNVMFLKNEMNLQANYPLNEDFTLQGGLNIGILNPLSDEPVGPPDAFYLGGPLTFRGYGGRSVGPKEGDNFVGAPMYWAGALHLYTPLPFRPAAGGFGDYFRFHFFANCGHIGEFNLSSPQDFLNDQKENLRMALGLGRAFWSRNTRSFRLLLTQLAKEKRHLKTAFMKNGYNSSIFEKLQRKRTHKEKSAETDKKEEFRDHTTIPYVKGTREGIARIPQCTRSERHTLPIKKIADFLPNPKNKLGVRVPGMYNIICLFYAYKSFSRIWQNNRRKAKEYIADIKRRRTEKSA